ncbi:hypothetical protein B5X24_HaOG203834 [Helicoverpa armigera]|nr:hypothetical protein B5X24_HaOG203834 [Helicoverpa armigera]
MKLLIVLCLMCVLVSFSSGKKKRAQQKSVEIRRHELDAKADCTKTLDPQLTPHRPRKPSERSTAQDHDIEDHDDEDYEEEDEEEDLEEDDELSDHEIAVYVSNQPQQPRQIS